MESTFPEYIKVLINPVQHVHVLWILRAAFRVPVREQLTGRGHCIQHLPKPTASFVLSLRNQSNVKGTGGKLSHQS